MLSCVCRWRDVVLGPPRVGVALLATLLALPVCAVADNSPVTIAVDATANRHSISPLIYGVAYAQTGWLRKLNCPLNRRGGNPTTRYNWLLNADNRANDYYYESLPYPSATPGEVADTFIAQSQKAGADPLITVPMLGWVANLGANRTSLWSFSIAKYGAQTGHDAQGFPDAGNGIWTNGNDVTGNDPNDANVPADSTFQQAWIQHMVSRWGSAASGGVSYYLLDNEPSIWFESHRDVHPIGATMDEILSDTVAYGSMLRSVDPTAMILGPEEWGWSGYFYSGYDQQYGALNGWNYFPDRTNHGGWDYLPWLLDQLRQYEASSGTRLLDYFSVHYYPQGGELSNDTSSATQLLRNRSTRSLWDPSYKDTSWIDDYVYLIPRIQGWVSTYYPGTKTAVTEYNWGAEQHINGATAQADILGIFGREGLDLATRWQTPKPSTPTFKAIQMYRNYDGKRSTFGDTSVSASAPDPDTVSSFASQRTSDGALTIMVISKYLSGNTPVTVNLAHFSAKGSAQVYQLTANNKIKHLADLAVSGAQIQMSVPRQSITLLVVPKR